VHAAYSLHLSELIYRTRDGERLFYRGFRKRGQQSIEFRRRRAVAFDSAVRLLEDQARRERERHLRCITRAEKARKYQHAFGMYRPAHFDLPLNIYDFASAQTNARRDAARAPESEIPEFYNRKPINLSDLLSASVDENSAAPNLFLN